MRVLLVEDEQAARSICLTLRLKGFNVLFDGNRQEAVDLAKYYYYDIVLLDLILPDIWISSATVASRRKDRRSRSS